jgi:arylsulfatase A-like enzyme
VPLVVHFPKGSGPTPGTSDFPAQTIDILPTALRAAGVPSALYQGVALQDTPSDHARVTRAHLDLEGHRFESARSYPQKVIRDLSSDGEVKAYDLATDPAEQAPLDLAPEHTRLLELLDAHKESIGEVEGQPTEISDELRQSLKAMGYLGDE